MTAKLYIKHAKPFTEVVVQAKGIKDNITIGCKCYTTEELDELREQFGTATDTSKLVRWSKQLNRIKTDIDLSDDEIDTQTKEFEDKIKKESVELQQKADEFYKSQITHIKNASMQLVSMDGAISDLLIADSREAKPIESLWGTPEECLAVLLRQYFGFTPFRDSLQTKILETVFDYKHEENAAKN